MLGAVVTSIYYCSHFNTDDCTFGYYNDDSGEKQVFFLRAGVICGIVAVLVVGLVLGLSAGFCCS
jgi:hypothetical protein